MTSPFSDHHLSVYPVPRVRSFDLDTMVERVNEVPRRSPSPGRGRPSHAKKITIDDDMEALLEKISSKTADRVADRVATKHAEELRDFQTQLTTKNEQLMKDFAASFDTKLENQAKTLRNEFTASLSEMEQRLRAAIPGSADATTVGAPSESGQSRFTTAPRNHAFQPQFIYVKGWLRDYAREEEQSLDSSSAHQAFTISLSHMSEATRSLIDIHATENLNCSRVLIKKFAVKLKAPSKQGAWAVRDEMHRVISSKSIKWGDVVPSVTVDQPPERKPMLRAGAIARSTLETMGCPAAKLRRPQWGPFKQYAVEDADGVEFAIPRLLVSWSESTGYVVLDENLKSVCPNLDPSALRMRMNSQLG